VFVEGFPSDQMGTNCWVVATAAGEECVVIDPGYRVVPQLDEVLAENRLRPVAVLLTHGHFDHTMSVVPVCGARDIPAYIHPDDRSQLTDPWSGISVPVGTPLFGQLTFSEPDDVRELVDGQSLSIAGLDFSVQLAPGHTPGSLVFGLSGPQAPEAPELFSGDVLFAGSIGRVDLPGGDPGAMLDSLVRVVLPLADETVVRPGHGPDTTIGRERGTNPYLRQAADLADPASRMPRTGL
jgi:hydroxyacylglutathione hydrolase